MSTDEQDRASGSVPHHYGNALAWKWVPAMPAALKRAHLHTLLYTLRAMANASGELRFHGDHKPMRIKDIARAAGCDEKDARDRLEAALRAGVVVVKGERRRGIRALYVIVLSPRPDWTAAAAHLAAVKAKREDAKRDQADRRPAPWADDENGGRSPELEDPENGGPPPELTDGTAQKERGTAPRPRTGDRPPTRTGDRPPNNPGVTHEVSHELAEVVFQPQVDGASGPQEIALQEEPEHPADTTPPPPNGTSLTRCRRCDIPLLRPGRSNLCHGCQQYAATRERHTA